MTLEHASYQPLLAELETRSRESYTHSKRVAALSERLGKQLRLTTVELYYLRVGSLLHDIGKKDIPANILHCEHALESEDWAVMKTHTMLGSKVATQRRLDERVVDAILFHHERFGGGGYPTGRRGTDIPFFARIVTLVDAYDTMISKRAYQQNPRRIDDALLEIERCAGTQFDPELVELFVRQQRERYRRE
jgi:putative nucleotidyltransferase with HDIG domain